MEALFKRKIIDKVIIYMIKGNYLMEILKMYDGKLGEGGPWKSPECSIQEPITKPEQSLARGRKVGGHSGRGNYLTRLKRCARGRASLEDYK